MKKKKLFLILIPSVILLLLLILFLPIPVGTMNDGGSREYRALTYRLVHWNRIQVSLLDGSTELYEKWCFYPVSDFDATIDELWLKELENMETESVFTATIIEIRENEFLVESDAGVTPPHRGKFLCKIQEDTKFSNGSRPIPCSDFGVGDMVYVAYTGEIMEMYPAQIPNVTCITLISSSGELSYKDSYVRVDGGGDNAHLFNRFSKNNVDADGWNCLPIIAIDSKESLDEMITGLKPFEEYASTLWYESALFTDFSTTYDEAFFLEKTLLLIYIAEPSSSNAHRIHRCYVEDGVCTVLVETLIPESGDCAMAGWLVCLEVEKDDVANLSFDAYRFRK